MDARDQRFSRRTFDGRWPNKQQDVYVVHILALDGTVATLRKRMSDATFQITVEADDRRATRAVPPDVARDLDSPELAQIIAEMKAELLAPARHYSLRTS